MTNEEWKDLEPMLRHWWGQPWSPEKAAMYRLALDRFSGRVVGDALASFLAEGGDFRPSAAAIVQRIAEPVGGKSWEEAWPLIQQAIRRVGRSIYAIDFDERHQEAINWLAGQDRVVAAYAARRGLCGPGSLGFEEVGGDHGGAALHRLGTDYREAVEQAKSRAAAGLPPVEERDLLVAERREGGGGLAEVLRRARPDAPALPAGGDDDADRERERCVARGTHRTDRAPVCVECGRE
jgi:hypothetical protein